MTAAAQTQLPAPRQPKAQIVAGGPVAALVPQSLDEAFRVAQAIAQSGLAPRGLDKPEQVMVAIMAGAELGLAPFQALQSFAVVNGRPTLWGDGLVAVARAQGVKVEERLDGEGDAAIAWCKVTRPDTGEEIERTFSVADAKKASLWGKQGPWQSYPKRMLAMRARAWALRDGCADMLRGFQVREEVEDYQPIRDVTPQASGLRARLEARQADNSGGFDEAHVERETAPHDLSMGEVRDEPPTDLIDGDNIPAQFTGEPADNGFPGDKPTTQNVAEDLGLKTGADLLAEKETAFDPIQWAADFNTDLADMDIEEIERALADPKLNDNFDTLKAVSPGTADALNKAITDRKAALAKGGAK